MYNMNEIKMASILNKLDSTIKSFNNNMNKEINTMNEIKMASILNKLDTQGVKIDFRTQKMFANGTIPGIGLMIEGRDETMSPELIELTYYLSQKPREAASLVRFCKNCLMAGNKPISMFEGNGNKKYFLCDNGIILNNEGVSICESNQYISYLLCNINKAKDNDDDIRALAFMDAFEEYVKYCHNKEDENGKKDYCELENEYLEEEEEEDYEEEEEYEEEDNDWNF